MVLQLAMACCILLLTLAGCGGERSSSGLDHRGHPVEWFVAPRPISGVRQVLVGEGPGAAVILRPLGGPAPRQGIIFLHGYLPVAPSFYGAWLHHLVLERHTVIYPVYQRPSTPTRSYQRFALQGIATALSHVSVDPRNLVVIGHTTGGALAFDYAAVAEQAGLPSPAGVLAVYPGQEPTPGGGDIGPVPLGRIAPRSRLVAIAGPGDPIPEGDREAHELLSGASQVPRAHRRFIAAKVEKTSDRFDAAPRRSFWGIADRLIHEVQQRG